MSAEDRWTEEAVRVAGDAAFDYLDGLGLPPGMTRPFGLAERVLEALATAGLLPIGSDARIERGKKIPNGGVSPCTARCRQETDHAHDRERTVWTGPWVEVKP